MSSLRFKLKATLWSSTFWFGLFTVTATICIGLIVYVEHNAQVQVVKQSKVAISDVFNIEYKPAIPSAFNVKSEAAVPATVTIESRLDGKFTHEEIKLLENGFENQVQPRLLKWLRTHWINFPSTKQLNLTHPLERDNSQHKQAAFLDEFMGRKTNGFFIECGAKDGQRLSNSLFFERFRNWTGLLVEPNPYDYKNLVLKHRNSYSINACLNTRNITGQYEFCPDGVYGGLVDEMDETHKERLRHPNDRIQVQCFTLWSILKAIGKKHVDLFSLDVEGAEVGVLKTIPFSELDIDIFLIEYLVANSLRSSLPKVKEITSCLSGHGYRLAKIMELDLLFVKEGKLYK